MLITTGLALAIGVVIGRLTGGRWHHLAEHRVKVWWLLLVGLIVPVGLDHIALGGFGTPLLLLADAALVAFAVANAHLIGLGIVAAGVAANALVIGLNSGMPVRPGAVIDAHLSTRSTEANIGYGHRHHREVPGDRLVFLADIIPVPELHEVVSFGDLFLAIGVADAAAHLMHPARRRLAAKA